MAPAELISGYRTNRGRCARGFTAPLRYEIQGGWTAWAIDRTRFKLLRAYVAFREDIKTIQFVSRTTEQ